MKIIDFHCDTIYKILQDQNHIELRKNNLSVDIEKLKTGNVMAQFFALFVDLKKNHSPLDTCLSMVDRFYHELSENEEHIAIAKNYHELMKNEEKGKISAFLTVEEGGVIEGRLYHLRNLYRLGVRLITLTWNYPNEIGYPNCCYKYQDKGLTPFGEEVVYEMNRLGMIIDVSHLSDRGFYDVARLSSHPFIASHSNARCVTQHSRNLSDEMIKILADKGGVMGINFEKSFLGNSSMSKVEDMVKHIKHIKNVGGIDVLSLGSDFDGISCKLEIQNIGEIEKLIMELRKNGFVEEEIEKICYKNAFRVIKEVCR